MSGKPKNLNPNHSSKSSPIASSQNLQVKHPSSGIRHPIPPPAVLPPTTPSQESFPTDLDIGPPAGNHPPRKSSLPSHRPQSNSNNIIPNPSTPSLTSRLSQPPVVFNASAPLEPSSSETSNLRIPSPSPTPSLSKAKVPGLGLTSKFLTRLTTLSTSNHDPDPTEPLQNVKGIDPTSQLPVYNPTPSPIPPTPTTSSAGYRERDPTYPTQSGIVVERLGEGADGVDTGGRHMWGVLVQEEDPDASASDDSDSTLENDGEGALRIRRR